MSRCRCIAVPILSLAFVALFVGKRLVAAEPAREFVEALRQQGHFDEAHAELDRWTKLDKPLMELADVVDFERGQTLLAQSHSATADMERFGLLRTANEHYQKFLDAHGDHELAIDAREQRGSAFVEMARLELNWTNERNGALKAETQRSARVYYDLAIAEFSDEEDRIRKALGSAPKVLQPRDVAAIARRDALRGTYVRVQLVRATILYEQAGTQSDPELRRKAYQQAAESAAGVFRKYRRRLAGLYARLQEARCFEALGDLQQASELYDELLDMPENPEPFRTLRTKTLVRAVLCWSDEKVGNAEKAIETAQSWLQQQRPVERSDADWLELRLSLARAHQRHAATQSAESDAANASLRAAVEEAQAVAGVESPHRTNAEALVNELTGMSPPKGP